MSLEEAMDNFTRGRRRKYGPIDLTTPFPLAPRERVRAAERGRSMETELRMLLTAIANGETVNG